MLVIGLLAVDEEMGIGKNGSLPWKHHKYDMNFFRILTDTEKVVMGRSTWDSLPVKPLPNRENYVLSDTNIGDSRVKTLNATETPPKDEDSLTFIIGGAKTLHHYRHYLDIMILSHIEGKYGCDVFFNKAALEDMVKIGAHLGDHLQGLLNISVYAKNNGSDYTLMNKIVELAAIKAIEEADFRDGK